MSHLPFPSQAQDSDAAALLQAIFEEKRHPTIENLLRWIAQRMNAFGCALWELADGANLQADLPQGYYFTAASWFAEKDDFFAMHDAPVDGTTVGRVFITQQPVILSDLSNEGGVRRGHPFFIKYKLGPLLSVPVPGGRWVLNLYRRKIEEQNVFNDEDQHRLMHLAALLPGLYNAVMDRNRLRLHYDVTEKIRKAMPGAGGKTPTKDQMKHLIQGVCDSVKRVFHCVEVSIFLEDPQEFPGKYDNIACTWDEVLTKKSYKTSDHKSSMTGWVLEHAKSLRITDLLRFESSHAEDFARIRDEFRGLNWGNRQHLMDQMLKRFNIAEEQELPPASFLAVPIMHGKSLLGVVRCCLTEAGPLYFSKLEQESLEQAAALIGQAWSSWLIQRNLDVENQCWRAVVTSIRKLNSFVVEQLGQSPNEAAILMESLRLTSAVIPHAPHNAIRLADEKKENLYFAAHLPVEGWPQARQKQFADKLAGMKMSIERDASAGANVYLDRKPYALTDTKHDPLYQGIYDEAGVHWLYFVPIEVGNECYGVLDVRGVGAEDSPVRIPEYIEAVAQLLGCQIGLYHSLALMKQKEQKLLERERKQEEHQKSVYEDLAHQLKGPVASAQRWARQSLLVLGWKSGRSTPLHGELSGNVLGNKLFKSLLAVRGLCRKARRVTSSLGILAADEDESEINPNLRAGDRSKIVRMLVEAAQDTERMTDAERGIQIVVNRHLLLDEKLENVRIDYDLLEQAISNLLDNAAKYSFPGTMVHVYADSNEQELALCVTNRGIRIEAKDVENCRKRHWRSKAAEQATGEGVGVGLYIVDKIMQAHDGRLEIIPSNVDSLTEIRLIFPIQS